MHDFTHLNELGEKEVSMFILNSLNSNEKTRYIVVNGSVAE